MKELATALAKAQAELRNPAFDSQNPHFKSRFASLAQVRDTITPVLSKHGLSIVQLPCNDEKGNVAVRTILLHESGDSIETTLTVPATKHDAHGAGSAITYARRYSLMAIVNVVGDEDDDANASVQQTNARMKKLRDVADAAIAAFAAGNEWGAYETVYALQDEDLLEVWSMLNSHSKIRSALKAMRRAENETQRKIDAESQRKIGAETA